MDPQEFKLVYQKYYRPIFLFAAKRAGDVEDAKDIAQWVFLALWKKEGLTGDARAWLYRCCRNRLIDLWKAKKGLHENTKDLTYLSEESESVELDIIESLVIPELLKEAKILPRQCRKVFDLSYYENLPAARISQIMGIGRQNVLNQKQRAILLLRNHLIKKGFYDDRTI